MSGKESYYADKEDVSAGAWKAKMLVRRVLGNDAIVNEYFKGQYFTYKDFLEVKELCDLPEYDETSELLDELGSHLKEPKSAVAMKDLMIEVMTDDLVEFKAGKSRWSPRFAGGKDVKPSCPASTGHLPHSL